MPGMVVFGRRWGIASDDLVFPGAFELFVRVLWWIGTMILYTYHKGHFDCNGRGVLHTYLVGLLVVLGLIILSLCAIVYVSAQGSITNSGPRRSMPALVYLRALLYIPELVWACLGAVWVSDDSKGCDPATVGAVIAAVVASWIILLFTALGVIFVFDPLGNPRPQPDATEPLGVRDLQSSEGSQFFSTARSMAVRVWENRLRLLCCCLPQDESHRAAFSSIAQLFSRFFSDTDLVPSDIAAGLALLHQEHDKMELSRDPQAVVTHSPSSPIGEDLETELEKTAHCMQFAAAAYGWPLYIYSNPFTGPCKLSGDCCRSHAAEYDIVGGDHLGCHFSSILQTTGLQYRDFIHVSFHNQIYEIPFYVALDHKREAVLVAVRGTLSLKDVLTDLEYKLVKPLPVMQFGAGWLQYWLCYVALIPSHPPVHASPLRGLLSKALADYSKDCGLSCAGRSGSQEGGGSASHCWAKVPDDYARRLSEPGLRLFATPRKGLASVSLPGRAAYLEARRPGESCFSQQGEQPLGSQACGWRSVTLAAAGKCKRRQKVELDGVV
ncbi:sn1-specific diacylglycerol lipase beta [Lates japonicus]|uniref:Sn1-specific diacylglycerol lipase beta n=1 Tax=Lates japonicus TaxID=270547 RepID=A0AAD3RK48_LATJO|nr:sn1-specific diacylglycerol lipase beta [Lates japonicus]